MDINKMTRKGFENLPFIKEETVVCDSIIILPKRLQHDSGFSFFSVVLCYNGNPIGKMLFYDCFHFLSASPIVWGVDVLYKSQLTRIILRQACKIDIDMHYIR